MAPIACCCLQSAGPSMPDLEPTLFPEFDWGAETQSACLRFDNQLKHVAQDDPSKTCSELCAAWAVLLACFTGLDTVCFGFESQHNATIASGHSGSVESAMQISVPANSSLHSILAEGFSALPQPTENKNKTPFNTILSICGLDCDASNYSDEEILGSGQDLPSWCRIRMSVDPVTLKTVLTWDPSFMSQSQAQSISTTYDKIFQEITSHPYTALSELNFLSEQNERQIMTWNNKPMRSAHKCIHQAVSMQGALRPDAEAVCAWDGSFSYEELLSLSDRLAHRLQASGIGPEVFVPICFDKSKWVVVSMLAVLKAGGIFVPLDPTQPLFRLQSLASKVDARTILCSPQHQQMLQTVAPDLIPVDHQLFMELTEHRDEVDCGTWSNGAYMIFTSGTTGEPKGALIQHGAIMSSALAHGPAMMMDSNTRSLQFAAFTFDVSITEILTCLILGGCVCIPSEEARLNAIEEAITQLGANWALLTPTFVKFINPANVPSLKTLVTGGEAMTQAIIRSWSHINLINCYGPAETSVVSHVHRGMVQGKNPLNIGFQVGIHCWVVDPYNHDRLMPIGAVGELVIEGHTLAREYYKEPEKTSEAFIIDPLWAKNQAKRDGPRRMYKTGDLVKYNHDGTFHIAGRKDAQVKFHGQRIELGEIEHHINTSPSIKHGMVILPREGFCKGRLMAIVQLCDALNQDLVPKGQPYKLIDGDLGETAQVNIAETRKLLTDRLPSYMVPSMWIAVEFIPRLQSGKLDRKKTAKWIDTMSEDLYRQLNPIAAVEPPTGQNSRNQFELELHKIWAHVLNLKGEQLGFHQSFLSVGGDSISAMQVMSECKKRGLGLAVSHIINCKSISALALQVKAIHRPVLQNETVEQPFELSPIQKLYFSRPGHAQGHYNQSFLLRTSRRIHDSDMRKAVETIIWRHSMLRARFREEANGEWTQRITNEVASSYRLRTVKLASCETVGHSIGESQTCLNITEGPLVAADLIERDGQDQLLFVVAHHLVIDLVSWRIILQELEQLLLHPEAFHDIDRPLPFQVWCKMQSEHSKTLTPAEALPVQGIPDGNAEYWGMQDMPNVYGQMTRQGFELDHSQTSLLLSKCHEALRTEIPDVLLAAVVFSFSQTFTDRPTPAIFAEGHGREVWDTSIDLSNVVGWFTTIYPVFAESNAQSSLIDTLKMVKDGRRQIPHNGRPYFASRWLTEDGEEAFSRHWPLEITFNYLGQYQQLEREGALFTPESNIAGEIREASEGTDVGPLTACISLFEVSAVIVKGSLRFSFGFNQNMNHQLKILEWISSCQQSLEKLVDSLASMAPEPTLSDFPLLSMTYDRLRLLTEEKLPSAGIRDITLVEDAYPCSPMQSGLLVSTTRQDVAYAAYTLHEVKTRSGEKVDVRRLASAWRRVVQYHPMLRTIFVESVALQDSLYDQVVLKEVDAPLCVSEKGTDEEALTALDVPISHRDSMLLHRFEVCTSISGRVFCKLDISHVIMDGTSLSIIFRDLALAYDGCLQPEVGPAYRDYIEYLQSQRVESAIDYWKSYLAGIEPCHFPVLDDGNLAESKTLKHLRVKFDELAALQSLCEERGVTIVNAINAAWALTLRLYTSSDEVCFGYLVSARDLQIEGIQDVVGPVINMVTCRLNMSGNISLGDATSIVQRDYLDCLEYRHIPLAQVHHALQLSDSALFNTALSYRKLPPTLESPPDLVLEECRPTYDPDEYNVSINIEAGEKDMAIDLMYWSDTLSDGQANNVASTFTKALSNVLHHCDEPISHLDHLGSWHRQQLCQWNQHIPEAVESCVHGLFQKQVSSRPDAPAIASWDMDFTYAELDDASTKLALHIRSLGVGPETCVMVCFDKSAFVIVSMLAILKAGGVCVPLDPAHPDAAIRLRVEDTRATIALVSPSLVSKLSSLTATTVAVDAHLIDTLSISQDLCLPQITPNHACFVIYTSGSTGRPKGVVLEHRGIASNAMYSGPKLGYGQDSRVLQFASYTFDNSLAEIFSTLSLGGCVCVPSEHERLNDLAGAINRYKVTMVDITPTVACFLKPSDVPTLKTVALGGEAVTAKCVEIWRDSVSLRCCYGPSECSVNSTFSDVIDRPGMATNIGRAIGSVSWVVDANDHSVLVPVGCVGELLVDGPIVSRGYLNLPERMEQSFVRPPDYIDGIVQDGKPDRRLYKTGDLVRYNSDGSLTYLGRKDTQVKLNGQRIELGEIEHHIGMNIPGDWESAVELVMSNGRTSLACFICTNADAPLCATSDASTVLDMNDAFRSRAKELEIVLSNAVPAYMVPSVWLPISKMPLTSSGKLDRRSLRLLGESVAATLIKSYKLALKSGRAPSSEMERQLANMWARLLHIDVASIGVQDNFFKLGGDSIGAMQLVTLARCSNINLTVAGVFQKPSLLDMANSAVPFSKVSTITYQPFSLVSDASSVHKLKEDISQLAGIDVGQVQDIYPCTALQEGLMALSIKEPGAYVAQLVYRLPDDVDATKFQKACNMVVEAEPTLRTRIVHVEDLGFLQAVVADEIPQWSSPSSLCDAEKTRCQIPGRNGGLLTNYGLVDNGSNGLFFVWTVHHAIYDGWCLPLILDKIKRCYHETLSPLQVKGPDYSNFIHYLIKRDRDDEADFWKSQLSNISAQHFPRLPNPDYEASATSLLIHKAALPSISGFEITVATRIRTAWALTVSTYSGANDVVFWETVTGRDAPVAGVEEVVGATLATVPTRVVLEPSKTINEILGSVQARAAAVRKHQFAGIQFIKHLSVDTAIACGAQNLLAINYGPRECIDDFWREQSNEMAGTNFYSYPLMLSCHFADGELETVVHFDANVISNSQIQRVMNQFSLMLDRVSSLELLHEKLGDMSLLSRQDLQTLRDVNGTITPVVDRLIHEVISTQKKAQAHEKLAVVSWDQNLKYSDLDLLSTRLAGVLVQAGLTASSIVPFCMAKSSLVIVSILAILKTGAAFVPLNPGHPDARISGILADTMATVILSSPEYAERLAKLGSKVISVSQDLFDDQNAPISPTEQLDPSLSATSPAYIIFTSGTTGKPKGTIVSHSAFCTSATAHGSAMGMTESSRVLQFASHTFDASIMEMLTTLIHGGTVCVPSDDERVHDITGAINRMGVNWALLTPSVAQLLDPSLVLGLETLVLGGEAMSSTHISCWAPSVRLMNAYGPSEAAVVAAVNSAVTPTSSPSNIGSAVGGICWVTDAANHDRLMPIGAVGELVIEGPILAQGYLNNTQKTEESFIVNPRWCEQFLTPSTDMHRRFYKTGDLVRLTDAGIEFHGRKDNQVKINGQRLELSEIEHYLSADTAIESCLAVVPGSGPFKGRLVAILTLHSLSIERGDSILAGEMHLVRKYNSSHLSAIRESLAGHLASYMIPSSWIIVDHIPLLPSGKLDRRSVVNWVNNMTSEQYHEVLDAQDQAYALDREPSEVEVKLRAAWAKVLNLKVDSVPFKQSFLHLGGDSISAMQLMAVCRSSNMAVSVRQIMRCKSIVELATCVTGVEDIIHAEERTNKPFDLSPIQKVYFEYIGTGSTHFNQSMLLGTTRNITYEELSFALKAIVKLHSMLRARFSQQDGHWYQHITDDISGSFTLRSHVNVDHARLLSLIEGSQTCLNIVQGPLFAIDMFAMEESGDQIISLVAHHLVVDVVSWNIILQDLQGYLRSRTYSPTKSIPFQTWSSIQHNEAQKASIEHVFHSVPLPQRDLSYWGMEGVLNLHQDSITANMGISTGLSDELSGLCHAHLQCDVVDVLLASLLSSFRQNFTDRPSPPPVFNEGHGREPGDGVLDLSRTVGWFTTLCPVLLPKGLPIENDILDVVRWVRDFRRKLPGKGRPYFAHCMLSKNDTHAPEWPVEIAFNFLGHIQKVESEGSVFKSFGSNMLDSVCSENDIGADVPRLALIEITASFSDRGLNFSFSFNRHMDRQTCIHSWIQTCKEHISTAAQRLSQVGPGRSIDLSLLPLEFKTELQIDQKLNEMGFARLDDIEAAYPCSAVQQGILFAQVRDSEYYSYSIKFSVKCAQPGGRIDVQRLSEAWQQLINRHSTLRTVFVDGLLQDGGISQVVLKSHRANISIVECSDAELTQRLREHSPLGLPTNRPPHRLSIFCTLDDTVTCILEMSHAISDGTSMPILFRDLALAYEGTLPPTTVSVYRDYISFLQRSQVSECSNYWRDYLAGAEPCCLPVTADGIHKPGALRALDQKISHPTELQTFCTERGVTLSTVFQLAWAIVLQAYTGLNDVCFGYLVAEREVPVTGIDQAIGVFVSMLVCRVRLDPSNSLNDILRAMQEDLTTAMNYKNVSLADFQHAMGNSTEPLFNTAYSFQRRSVSKDMRTGAISFDMRDAEDPSEYDLTVNVEVWDSVAELQLCYWENRISTSQVVHIASTLDQVLSSISTSDLALPIGDLDILSEHGRQQLVAWNADEPEALETCVHHVIESNAERLPRSTPAVEAWDASFTYTELNTIASQLARYLVSLGVGLEMYIPLCFEKSAWNVVAMMAVLKAGGAFVPLDSTHPSERIKFLVRNVDAKLIICSTSLTSKFSDLDIPTIALGKELISALPYALEGLPTSPVRPENAAYIIFTSGTTGLPKGTIVEHRSFTTGGTAHAKAIMMASASRVLQFASHTFDASVMEILSTLLVGGCICVPSDDERMNNLAGVIAKFNVNWTLLTPSVVNVLKPGSVPTLKVLVTGGEAMSRDHISKWRGHAALINAYGPSETSVIASTSTKVDLEGNILNIDPATIGHSVGSRCWIVDPRNHNRLMPIGSTGELLVEGPIVARGYLDNEVKTKKAFIQHPEWRTAMALGGDRTDRMYKTGDLVSYNSDGSLKYVSRKDTQIKLNGQRIELGEIEHHVKTNLPVEVQSAVDIVVPQSKISTKALAIFFTANDSVEGDSVTDVDSILATMSSASHELMQSLKTELGKALPSYMVPNIYIPLVKMPWTLAGKLDRQRLKSIARAIPPQQMVSYKLSRSSPSRLPTTSMQRKLQKAWARVLDVRSTDISQDDSFFRLGGDSVGAMKLVGAARMEGVVLNVMSIFKNPILSDMAMSCRNSQQSATRSIEPFSLLSGVASPSLLIDELAGLCGIHKSQIQDVYPCSSLQEGLVASSLQQPGAYVARYVFRLPLSTDMARFRLAWRKTIDRVDILRSRIVNASSLKSYQVVLKPTEIDWGYYDSLESAEDKTKLVPEKNGGVLAHYHLVTSADTGCYYFVWIVHHSLYDAWSMPSLLQIVSQYYHGNADSLGPLADYTSFIKYLVDLDAEASDEFWRSRFHNAPSISHFPSISCATDVASSQESLTRTIRYDRNGLGMDITIPTIIRAAWALVLGSQAGSDDVVFGETLSGRDVDVEFVEDILGPTLTTVPSRVQINRGMTVGEFLSLLHRQAADVIPYQHAGLQRIKRLSDAISVACDFQNLLVIQSSSQKTGQQDFLQPLADDPDGQGFFTYPLVVECLVESRELVITIHHDGKVIPSWQANRIAHQFDSLVGQFIDLSLQPTRLVSEIRLYGREDVDMIERWNNWTFEPLDETIPSLFWQVLKAPNTNTAIHAWDGHLSYEAVTKHAVSLAKLLVQKGLQPNTLVPCCMDKSLWTSISMLAVILAGGAIIPLDPVHPAARHKDITNDCQARIALCSPQYEDRFRDLVESVILVDGELFSTHLICQNGLGPQDLPAVTSQDPAFVIYTSGSTGKPKGVIIEHGSFVASSKAFTKAMNLNPASRVFHFTSYAFDVSMGETFGALTIGACLCIPSEEMKLNDLPGAMNTLGATWAFLTPSIANLQDPSRFTTLKTLVCGGEAMTPETISIWANRVQLINGYGPAECSVFAVANVSVSDAKDATNIGYSMGGCHTWVVDPRDHSYLVPVGCAGELLISGPIVSRGYLNDTERTAESFIENPPWMDCLASQENRQRPFRLYKTGDIVKYLPDGSLRYLGRKDHQVKLHGQRLELGEIEAHLESNPRICHSLVNLPTTGPFKGRLVAIVSLRVTVPRDSCLKTADFVPISESAVQVARAEISAVQQELSEHLPSYMIPSAWLAVEAIPLLLSGKADRASSQKWLASLDINTSKMAIDLDGGRDTVDSEDTTPVCRQLRRIWASVLNIAEAETPLNRSLISLGGDSIMAIQILTRCHEQSIALTMHEIMSARSILQLATTIETQDRQVRNKVYERDEDDSQAFELSPIQQLFFANSLDKDIGDRFNQSQMLSIKRPINVETLKHALQGLVQRHPMLRARFNKLPQGHWTQHITPDVESSYIFTSRKVTGESQLVQFVASSHRQINISGPVFIADLFEQSDGSQVLSLIAHHLVVDVVSWINIIQDLEKLLTNPVSSLLPSNILSFRQWNLAQIEHAKSLDSRDEDLLPFHVQPANLDFWGMSQTSNVYEDVKQKSFVVSEPSIVSSIMTGSHRALKTEPLDLFMSAILRSFAHSFEERQLPTLFNEGHGREPWDHTIDVSQTVGWFTSLCPIQISQDGIDLNKGIECVRRVKDIRRSIPNNGRPYFAHRYLCKSQEHHQPIEILVNFLGRTQQTTDNNSLFSSFEFIKEHDMSSISDVAPETRRLALFEISISIVDEGINFTFMFNRHMLHQESIEKWVSNCREVLIETAKTLVDAPPTPSLSDFPLMPIGYADLDEIITKHLRTAHVSFDNVEDIYPSSPMQTGILLSQLLDSSQYLFHLVLQVSSPGGSSIDTSKLAQAYHQVIDRHAALRTTFIPSSRHGSSFDQVVLNNVASRVRTIQCREIDVMAELNAVSLDESNKKNHGPMLPHQITICETPQGKAFMKLELNHAITDGASTSIILRDISDAYMNSLSTAEAPSYKEYIKYISNQRAESSFDFWRSYLSGSQYTEFPSINPEQVSHRTLGSVEVQFSRFSELHSLGSTFGVTFSNIVMVAWAIVLRSYTNSDDVCFGYLASGRDIRIDGIDDIVGPFINMLVFRCHFSPDKLLKTLFLEAHHDHMASVSHQHFSLARISHSLGHAKRGFFNTAVSIQNSGVSSGPEPNSLRFESLDAFDPSEYAITLNANATRGDEGIVFRYWTNVISSSQAQDLATTMSELLSDLIDQSDKALSHLRLSQITSVPTSEYTGSPKVNGWTFHQDDSDSEPRMKSSTISASSTLLGAGDAAFLSSNLSDIFARDKKDLESKLSALWRNSLDREDSQVSHTDNFFECGGDSIIAMSMVGNARELNLSLTVADIFKNPEFGSLLNILKVKAHEDNDTTSMSNHLCPSEPSKMDTNIVKQVYEPLSMLGRDDAEQFVRDHICPLVGVSRASIIDVLPTTDFQDQAIQSSLLQSRWQLNTFYLDGTGPLDVALLQESVTNLIAAYDVLRTVFVSYRNRYLQVILRQVQTVLTVCHVDDIEQFSLDLKSDYEHEPSHPEQPSIRFTLAQHNSSERHRIFMRISHAQYDGVCFPEILQTLKTSYEGEPIQPTPYYASYIHKILGGSNSVHYAYWRAVLANSAPTDLFPHERRTSLHLRPVKTLRKVVSTPSLSSLNITTSTVIKAAWSVVLAEATGKTDVVFGQIISGRNVSSVPGIESIVGPCLNIIPVRIDHQSSWNVLQLLRYIQDQQVDAMPHESLGFREIISKCTDWGDDGVNGFSTVVQHQSMSQTQRLSIGENTYQVGVMASHQDTADFSVVTTPQDLDNIEHLSW
ncbi:non-ribosomal peptide synthetase [Fusarium beomiforme]|uniref:Non-ribosomal peptide synthetase n=1 Tax=Fusarium beomiforme TaxID=44412 RepID=A0A9P5APG0_9HYPO|nr:non-ribosomal peptide synthetase [Fusarium beomiforme]